LREGQVVTVVEVVMMVVVWEVFVEKVVFLVREWMEEISEVWEGIVEVVKRVGEGVVN
jgi:hypothetical protein